MVIFRGERMPGASRTAWSASVCAVTGAACRRDAPGLRVRGGWPAAVPRPVGFRP